jgi:PTH1 family peptidyl-tRNA hydrolase
MKIIVGLGNPGSKYKDTRHNIGFDVVAELAKRHFTDRPKAQFDSEIAEIRIGTEKCLLISPLTYMNLSGKAVQAAVAFYKVSAQCDLMIVCDDLNLASGRIRVRARGSAGGQNGIKDIINRLGSPDFARLRVGIGKPPPRWDTADYVLGKFDSQERSLIDAAIATSANAIEAWVEEGVQYVMNRFNADPAKAKKRAEAKEEKPVTLLDPNICDPYRSGRNHSQRQSSQ